MTTSTLYPPAMSQIKITGDITKVDADKRQAFGWASITEIDGSPVVDLQNDVIKTDELERAAYEYVLSSRVGGEMHKREKNAPKQIGTLIESVVLTPEKIEKMGLPSNTPSGWWVGFKVHDDNVWKSVKKGQYSGFSIHGKGYRKQIDESEIFGKNVIHVDSYTRSDGSTVAAHTRNVGAGTALNAALATASTAIAAHYASSWSVGGRTGKLAAIGYGVYALGTLGSVLADFAGSIRNRSQSDAGSAVAVANMAAEHDLQQSRRTGLIHDGRRPTGEIDYEQAARDLDARFNEPGSQALNEAFDELQRARSTTSKNVSKGVIQDDFADSVSVLANVLKMDPAEFLYELGSRFGEPRAVSIQELAEFMDDMIKKVGKHLIGRHEQEDHGRRHSRRDHKGVTRSGARAEGDIDRNNRRRETVAQEIEAGLLPQGSTGDPVQDAMNLGGLSIQEVHEDMYSWANERGMGDAGMGTSETAQYMQDRGFWPSTTGKHLLGRHNQEDHDPTKNKSNLPSHSRRDHKFGSTAFGAVSGALTGAYFGGPIGAALLGVAGADLGSRASVADRGLPHIDLDDMVSQVGPEPDANASNQERIDYINRSIDYLDDTGNLNMDMINNANAMIQTLQDDKSVDKHLIGRHDQDDHNPHGRHARSDHGRGAAIGAGLGTAAAIGGTLASRRLGGAVRGLRTLGVGGALAGAGVGYNLGGGQVAGNRPDAGRAARASVALTNFTVPGGLAAPIRRGIYGDPNDRIRRNRQNRIGKSFNPEQSHGADMEELIAESIMKALDASRSEGEFMERVADIGDAIDRSFISKGYEDVEKQTVTVQGYTRSDGAQIPTHERKISRRAAAALAGAAATAAGIYGGARLRGAIGAARRTRTLAQGMANFRGLPGAGRSTSRAAIGGPRAALPSGLSGSTAMVPAGGRGVAFNSSPQVMSTTRNRMPWSGRQRTAAAAGGAAAATGGAAAVETGRRRRRDRNLS